MPNGPLLAEVIGWSLNSKDTISPPMGAVPIQ